jgi:hypothetical protein
MYFVLKDASGNAQTSLTKLEYTTTDVTAPTPGNSGTPTTSNASSNGITVNWTKGTDNVTTQSGLQYLVYYSTSNNISTVSDMESYGTAVGSYAANISTIDITGLSSSTTYYFNLIVKDESDNKTAYSVVSSTTTAEVSYPDGYTANFTNTDGGDPPYYSSMTFTKSGDVNSKPSYTAPYVDDSTGTNQTMTILWDTVDNRWEIHDSIVDSASYDPMTYFHPTNTEISPPLSGWTDDCDFGNITLTEN